ncbi:MAG: hypothetical protein LBV26_04380, partial [Bacteroidales bacterium]|nr:hypothetical protein [Bacteroidales bacterium]
MKYYYNIWLILMALSAPTASLSAQGNQIGGVINTYRHVTDIAPDRQSVGLDNVDGLARGDTILLIQMKGAIMYGDYGGSTGYGTLAELRGEPGKHEFMIIDNISATSVSFTRTIKNNYDVSGLVQLIKVPSFSSAHVASTLTSEPWDSTTATGGVLAFIVGGTLSLGADIDVAGKGFKGGSAVNDNGTQTANDLYYNTASSAAGEKGEGVANYVRIDAAPTIVPTLPDYAKGRGTNFTGGGGSSAYAGAGGGAGWNNGGQGGNPAPSAILGYDPGPDRWGQQSKSIMGTSLGEMNNRLYLGSGGGGSTYSNVPPEQLELVSNGASGGGIVIIICGTLEGNGHSIIADGATPSVTASGTAGAGGGGGGGAIAVYAHSFAGGAAGNITLSAQGGKGGNTNNFYGEGGGGGGGFIITKTSDNNIPASVARLYNGGDQGSVNPPTYTQVSLPGSIGYEAPNFYTPILNGFLYNNIYSEVTGNSIDSVCYSAPIMDITGSTPAIPDGSTGFITWQLAVKQNPDDVPLDTDYANIQGHENIPLPLGIDYLGTGAPLLPPAPPSYTVWIRRVVTAVMPAEDDVIDTSQPVRITVHPEIEGNTI